MLIYSCAGNSSGAAPITGNIVIPVISGIGQSNLGNTNGVADPTGIPSGNGLFLSQYDSPNLITTISPIPNVGIYPFMPATIIANHPTWTPAIMRHFQNNTLMSQWQKGQPLGDQLRIGKTSLINKLSGFTTIRPLNLIVWNGESNGLTAPNAAVYENELRTCLNQIDVDWGPTRTIIVLIPTDFFSVPFRATIRAAQVTVASEQPWRVTANIDGASNNGLHLDTPGFQFANSIISPLIQ